MSTRKDFIRQSAILGAGSLLLPSTTFGNQGLEGAKYRRQMSISTHDRISGTPAQVKVLDQFLAYAAKQPGVKFMRKDDIAQLAFKDKTTLIDTDYK
jgi:hypothetical protein